MNDLTYASFWARAGATIIDVLLSSLIILPLLTLIYGQDYWYSQHMVQGVWDFVLNWILPAVAIILFWVYRSATPGKIVFKLIIVDAQTGEKPSVTKLIIRYLGYYVSIIPLFAGIFWVALDERKQGWHDKLAGTVVVKQNSLTTDDIA